MAKIKGTAIRGALKYVKESGYPGGIAAIIAELPEESSTHFKRQILSGIWYPYEAYSSLLEVIDKRIGHDDLSLMPEVGRFAALQDSGSIFKIITTFFTVEKLLERVSFFWGRYCDEGVFETRDVETGRGTGVIRDLEGISKHHCHLIQGWVEAMAIQAGATEASCRKVKCVHRGDPWCEYQGEWTSKS